MTRNWSDILDEMEQWSQDLDRFMTHLNSRSRSMLTAYNNVAWNPSVNIYEMDDALIVIAELAGVEPEEINVKYEGNRLLVWGQRRQILPAEVRMVHRMEIQLGPFAFVVNLPGSVSAEEAEARLENGILQIRLPRRSTAQAGMIQIQHRQKEDSGRGLE